MENAKGRILIKSFLLIVSAKGFWSFGNNGKFTVKLRKLKIQGSH
jgi:hypothetical protein